MLGQDEFLVFEEIEDRPDLKQLYYERLTSSDMDLSIFLKQ